jgi:hypothetical protein
MKVKFPLGAGLIHGAAMVMALVLACGRADAAGTASDTAANYSNTNSPGWGVTPPNNGSGFGAWSITLNNANNPPYVGTYLDTGSPIVTGGFSWGTYANGTGDNGMITMTRPFTAGGSGSSSLYNQTFSLDLASGGIGNGNGGPPNSELGFSIGTAFSFFYLGTGSDNFDFSVDPRRAPIVTPVNFSELSSGLHISLGVGGPLNGASESYTLTVSPFLGGSPYYTTTGTFNGSANSTSFFSYTDSNTTGNGYLNNLNITVEAAPEPSSLALLGLSGLAAVFTVRRRK